MEQNQQEMQYCYETVVNIVADMVTEYMKSAESPIEIIAVNYTIPSYVILNNHCDGAVFYEIAVA